MVQIVAGARGKGKTKHLIDKANEVVKTADGSVVYLDKSTKHMHELDIKIRLINVLDFPVLSAGGFLGFIAGIISQDHDLQYMFLDSFLRLSHVEEDPSKLENVLIELEKLGQMFGVTFVCCISLDAAELPETQKGNVIISL